MEKISFCLINMALFNFKDPQIVICFHMIGILGNTYLETLIGKGKVSNSDCYVSYVLPDVRNNVSSRTLDGLLETHQTEVLLA